MKIMSYSMNTIEDALEDINVSFNFTGNLVYVRAKVTSVTDGTITSIQLNS